MVTQNTEIAPWHDRNNKYNGGIIILAKKYFTTQQLLCNNLLVRKIFE